MLANGKLVEKALDIAQITGGTNKALVRTSEVEVDGGSLLLSFDPIQGDAIVSAIEIMPANSER